MCNCLKSQTTHPLLEILSGEIYKWLINVATIATDTWQNALSHSKVSTGN